MNLNEIFLEYHINPVRQERTRLDLFVPSLPLAGRRPVLGLHCGLQHVHDEGRVLLQLDPPVRGEDFLPVPQKELHGLALQISRVVNVSQYQNVHNLRTQNYHLSKN